MNRDKPTVLIVEDDLSSIALLRTILEPGSNLLEASDGATALKIISETLPDVILVDLELPDISGLEVCRKIKAGEATKKIPVLFLTAHDDIILEAQAFDVGAVDYIVKPVSPLRVMMRLNAHLEIKIPMQLLK